MQPSKTRQVALTGLLFALALILGALESFLAPLLGLPFGIKIGLANIVVMYALLFLTPWHALALVLLKAGFGAVTRGLLAGTFSLAGGLLSFLVMLILLKLPRQPSVTVLSICGAIAHNAGQLLLSRITLGVGASFFAPILLLAGIVTGSLTAISLRVLLPALERAGFPCKHPAPLPKVNPSGNTDETNLD